MYLMRECCLIMMHTFALHFLATAGSTFLTSSTTIKSSTSLSSSRITTTETIFSSSRTTTTTATTSAEPLLSLPLNDQDQDQDEIRTNEVLNRKCPLKCLCNYDELRRFQTICSKGIYQWFSGNILLIPVFSWKDMIKWLSDYDFVSKS